MANLQTITSATKGKMKRDQQAFNYSLRSKNKTESPIRGQILDKTLNVLTYMAYSGA